MTNWLRDEEAAQLRFEFETEIRRLEGGLARVPRFATISLRSWQAPNRWAATLRTSALSDAADPPD